MAEEHCPGCRGYTTDWDTACPGLPALEAALPGREPPLDMAGHATWLGDIALPGLCHCRTGKPHDVGGQAGYDQEHDRADRTGHAGPGP